ncbi:hypothetical protein INR49_017747 [Caranx melampygus]|nr:hypothetical protein INR49_017747 [Caranx melampygus]
MLDHTTDSCPTFFHHFARCCHKRETVQMHATPAYPRHYSARLQRPVSSLANLKWRGNVGLEYRRHCVHCGLCAVLVGSLLLKKEVISSASVGTSSISWWSEAAAGNFPVEEKDTNFSVESTIKVYSGRMLEKRKDGGGEEEEGGGRVGGGGVEAQETSLCTSAGDLSNNENLQWITSDATGQLTSGRDVRRRRATERSHMLVSLLSLLGDGFEGSLAAFPLAEAAVSVVVAAAAAPAAAVTVVTTVRLVCSSLRASGLGCVGGACSAGGWTKAKLDAELQDGFLLLMDGLVQILQNHLQLFLVFTLTFTI